MNENEHLNRIFSDKNETDLYVGAPVDNLCISVIENYYFHTNKLYI